MRALTTLLLIGAAGCTGGTIDLRTGSNAVPTVEGVVNGAAFRARHITSSPLERFQDSFGLLFFDTAAEPCQQAPDDLGWRNVDAYMTLAPGTYLVDASAGADPDSIQAGGFSWTVSEGTGAGARFSSGWVRIDEVHRPTNQDDESWVTGALDLEGRDGSWVTGSFEEVALCYDP